MEETGRKGETEEFGQTNTNFGQAARCYVLFYIIGFKSKFFYIPNISSHNASAQGGHSKTEADVEILRRRKEDAEREVRRRETIEEGALMQ